MSEFISVPLFIDLIYIPFYLDGYQTVIQWLSNL